MNFVVFGGSGFIGTHLVKMLRNEEAGDEDRIYVLDIVMPGEEGVVPGIVEELPGVIYVRTDVRKPIELDFEPTPDDVIFNLAAVHRTPGHEDREYFETNILGAREVTRFARAEGIKKILFTSSIAPYGPSEEPKDEDSLTTPNSPYGISKLAAEYIHRIWQSEDAGRKLVILRPGIVYGRGEHGNMTRLYDGIRKRYFFYTGRRDTIKASIYVKELVRFMKFCILDDPAPGTEIFNCTYEPAYTIEEIAETMMLSTGLERHIFLVPGGLLMAAARVLGPLGGKKLGIHPERVKKLMLSTNISGAKMAASGYEWKYSLEESFRDWLSDCGGEGLF